MTYKASWLFVLMSLTGCKAGPNYREPVFPLPGHWQIESQKVDLKSVDQEDLKTWWKSFEDPLLNSLMAQALESNLDLKIALTRVDQARAERSGSRAELFPSVNADAGALRTQNPLPGLVPGIRFNQFQLGFDALWEIDLFGRLQRRLEAASADLDAAVEQHRQAMVMLTSELARSYIEYRSLQNQLRITRSNQEAQRHTLELTELLFKEGVWSCPNLTDIFSWSRVSLDL